MNTAEELKLVIEVENALQSFQEPEALADYLGIEVEFLITWLGAPNGMAPLILGFILGRRAEAHKKKVQ
jgi:hypothetical protein